MYTPHPKDTDGIVLDPSLADLTEKIAENVHEIWAYNRIKDGWTYGETRSEELLTTPCLVPYSELPEKEKEYDRNTALETLKLVIALGYNIEKRKDSE